MKFSEAWLREWVNPNVSTEELADQLSMAGLEVDSVEPVAPAFSGVVVGEVLSITPHPDAEKLRICSVNTGQGEPLQIICGAANVAQGMRVPTAIVGATLPGDFKIKKAKLRGVESFGMICSASELGLADSSNGIMPLPDDAPVGEDFRAYLALDDQAIDVDLTPDRGDCLGMLGLTREVGVINRCAVETPAFAPVAPQLEERFSVELLADAACPRYTCRVLRGVRVDAETPLWMRERLRRSGIRSLGPLVDVTNYVMLELGQPMHAFDLAKLSGPIRVRMAEPGEKLMLLGGQEIELNSDSLLIADANGPLALAGIMGGESSAVSEKTKDILLESAFFTPTAIIGKARSYGLHTDSSHRFERGVDPLVQVKAIERATELLLAITGGQPGPVVEVSSSDIIEQRPLIKLRQERVNKVLGVAIARDEIADILKRLDMQLEDNPEGWQVRAPSCRFDIAIEEDLIEEIGRIYGYARIPTNSGLSALSMKIKPEAQFDLMRAKQCLTDRDYFEVITYSFVTSEIQKLIDPDQEGVVLSNPISADMSVMRTSLWPGLLQTVRYNQSRQQNRLRLFESGLSFRQVPDGIEQELMLACVITGQREAEQWSGATAPVDFFDLKGDLQAVLAQNGAADQVSFVQAEHPALHPGQSAKVLHCGEPLGWIGMLHPELEKRLDLAGRTYVLEIRLNVLAHGSIPHFSPLSKFPSIRRDIALVVDAGMEFATVETCIRKNAPEIVKDILLFDVYTGSNVDLGRKSLALGLILQEKSHTLTEQEVDTAMAVVLRALADELDAKLRD